MTRKIVLAFVLGISILFAGTSQVPAQVTLPSAPTAESVAAESPNQVPGLKLPAPFKVGTDEGFVTVKAECKGPVEWIVLTTAPRVKYKVAEADKEVIVSVPTKACTITVFCYGVVDGKLTKPARCDITVGEGGDGGGGDDKDKDKDKPKPAPVKGPLNLTLIEDPAKRTADYTLLTNWLANKAELQKLGHRAFLLSHRDAQVTNPANGFDKLVQRFNLPLLVIQDSDGKLLGAGPAPKTLDDLKRMLTQGR